MSDVAAQVAVAATIALSNTEQAQADAHAPIPTGNPKPNKPLPPLSDPGEADKEQRDQDKLNSPCVPGETTILGNFKDTKLFVDNPQPGKDALFLERYTWDKNQQWLDRSLKCGNDYALASDPVRMENGANIPSVTARELDYLGKKGVDTQNIPTIPPPNASGGPGLSPVGPIILGGLAAGGAAAAGYAIGGGLKLPGLGGGEVVNSMR